LEYLKYKIQEKNHILTILIIEYKKFESSYICLQ